MNYADANAPVPVATTEALFWADASGDRIGGPIAGTVEAISAGTPVGSPSQPFHFRASDLGPAPQGATQLEAVVDPDNLVAESDETNNVQALALPTLSPTLKWDDAGGVDVGYAVNGDPGAQILADTRVDLYWSSSDKFADRLGDPIDSVDVPAGKEAGDNDAFPVSAATLGDPSDGATHLLAVTDPDNLLGNSSEANNVQALALPDLSPTLQWDPEGGVDLGYTVGSAPVPTDTTVDLYWSSTSDISGAIGDPISAATQDIAAGTAEGASVPVQLTASDLGDPPVGAAYLLAVADPDNLIVESDKTNNV
jgi:hypothetical protein